MHSVTFLNGRNGEVAFSLALTYSRSLSVCPQYITYKTVLRSVPLRALLVHSTHRSSKLIARLLSIRIKCTTTRYKKYLQMNVKMVFNSQKRAEKEAAKRKRGKKKTHAKRKLYRSERKKRNENNGGSILKR